MPTQPVHSDRVADMVLVLAAALGLDEDETTRIHMAAHLHDIGKIALFSTTAGSLSVSASAALRGAASSYR